MKLTIERLREVLQYDPESGQFTRLLVTSMRVHGTVGQPAGGLDVSTGYLVVGIDGLRYFAHRLAWFYMNGRWPHGSIDHKDGDKLNNRFCNLRDSSARLNSQNMRKAFRNNRTGFLGVSPSGVRYRATIQVDGKQVHIGRFDTPEAAHSAYAAKKRELHEWGTL